MPRRTALTAGRVALPEAKNLKYEFQVVGDVDDGFTSAEISEGGSIALVRVFEAGGGWQCGADWASASANGIDGRGVTSRDELSHYVNRTAATHQQV